jgi:hypothetical protein
MLITRLPFPLEDAMRAIKVVTNDGNAYYDIVSRLKSTHLRFSSIPPGQDFDPRQDLALTSRKEVPMLGGDAVAIEDLDQDPLIMEGQLLSRLVEKSRRDLLIGIDPGSRIGLVVFYGGRELGALTTVSGEKLVEMVVAVAEGVQHSSLSVKIGAGEPKSSSQLARQLRNELEESASVEIVDESGTSSGKRGAIGATRDQRAAARIAFRKGSEFSHAWRPKRKHG